MTPQEKNLLTKMLYNREAELALDFKEIGKLKPEIAPPKKIRTLEHKAWQVPGFQILKALALTVIDMLKERLRIDIIEPCYGLYQNLWYLVKKSQPGKYGLVNVAVELNRVTIRNANLQISANEFSKEFAGCIVVSVIDFFSGYDQVELNEGSRHLTAFNTTLGLMRMTTLPQDATNSVPQFIRIETKILAAHLRDQAKRFLDDLEVKKPNTTYNNEEVGLGIWRYILEYIQNLDAVLTVFERDEVTISDAKSQFCRAGIKIVGFIYDANRRHTDTAKVLKIIDWPACTNITTAQAFRGVCVYSRI